MIDYRNEGGKYSTSNLLIIPKYFDIVYSFEFIHGLWHHASQLFSTVHSGFWYLPWWSVYIMKPRKSATHATASVKGDNIAAKHSQAIVVYRVPHSTKAHTINTFCHVLKLSKIILAEWTFEMFPKFISKCVSPLCSRRIFFNEKSIKTLSLP